MDHFCPHCDQPITTHAAIDPFGHIFATGRMFQKAVSLRRPKLIVLIGMWLLFGFDLLFIALPLCVGFIKNGFEEISDQPTKALGVVILLGMTILYSWILAKVTGNFVKSKTHTNSD